MAEETLAIGIVGTKRLAAQLRRAIGTSRVALKRAMRDVLNDALRRASLAVTGGVVRVRTGHLRRSLDTQVRASDAGIAGTLRARAVYARYIEEGTRPHEIRPVRASALSFAAGGALVFARHVQHPGTPPRPFLRPAVEGAVEGPPSARERFLEALRSALQK